jgi:hypothetical protein
MTVIHQDLAVGRWAKMSLCEQMANIGSDVSRALNWQKKNNEEYCHKSLFRALDLIGLTLESTKKGSHLKEIARLREALLDYFLGENEFKSSETLLRKYFNHFNFAVRA